MALLMPEGKHTTREGLLLGLSEYYNYPGRLAVFRRKFESVARRDGEDPAAFAMELEILAVWGFGVSARRPGPRWSGIDLSRNSGLVD